MVRYITLVKTYIQHDTPINKFIHEVVLNIAKIFGQAFLNMMRERNAQIQDALHLTRVKQSGELGHKC